MRRGVGVSGGDWETDQRIAQTAVESIGAKSALIDAVDAGLAN